MRSTAARWVARMASLALAVVDPARPPAVVVAVAVLVAAVLVAAVLVVVASEGHRLAA
jgi:hypothetical protein